MSDYLNQLFSLNGKTAVVIGGTLSVAAKKKPKHA